MSEALRPESQLSPQEVLQGGAEFLQHFGVAANPLEQPEEFAEALSQLDPRYQGGRELVRWQLEADQTQWPEATKQVIMRTAENMRMLVSETPLRGEHDVVIVLGGARQANLDRTYYVASAVSGGEASTAYLSVAGSTRKLNEAEQENTANYAPGATTEWDLCAAAAKAAAEGYPGVITSQMLIEDRKAGTPIVIEQVLSSLQSSGALREGARVAAVTTQIYQASTELDLARVAKRFGISKTFTAGNPSDPNIVAKRTPATYLSEVLRTLKAAANAVEDDAKILEKAKERGDYPHGPFMGWKDEKTAAANGFYTSNGITYRGWDDPGSFEGSI